MEKLFVSGSLVLLLFIFLFQNNAQVTSFEMKMSTGKKTAFKLKCNRSLLYFLWCCVMLWGHSELSLIAKILVKYFSWLIHISLRELSKLNYCFNYVYLKKKKKKEDISVWIKWSKPFSSVPDLLILISTQEIRTKFIRQSIFCQLPPSQFLSDYCLSRHCFSIYP